MVRRSRKILLIFFVAGLFAAGPIVRTAIAAGQATTPGTQTITPESPKVAAGEADAKKLLLLMDTDKNGKVSKQEFMNFMEAEFTRLDKNKDGELDVKELTQSQLVPSHHGKVK
jgi:EF hand